MSKRAVNVLAVDSASPTLSTAVSASGRVFHASTTTAKPHDEALWSLIDAVLKKAGVTLDQLSAIAAASGPGRFTGIRIGMAFAAVAASKLGIPALAISRLEGLAWRLPKGPGCAAIPGWKGERYYQLFRRGENRKKGRDPQLAIPWAEGPPAWVSEGQWAERAEELARAGAQILEAEADARDLLGPALAALERKRLPRFAPLYLKPAGYEKLAR